MNDDKCYSSDVDVIDICTAKGIVTHIVHHCGIFHTLNSIFHTI